MKRDPRTEKYLEYYVSLLYLLRIHMTAQYNS